MRDRHLDSARWRFTTRGRSGLPLSLRLTPNRTKTTAGRFGESISRIILRFLCSTRARSPAQLCPVACPQHAQRLLRRGLWDGQIGQLLAQIAPSKAPTEAGFETDPNTVLITPIPGGPVYERDTRIDDAIAYACRMAGRDFTQAEWATEFGDRPYQRTCPEDRQVALPVTRAADLPAIRPHVVGPRSSSMTSWRPLWRWS